MEIEVLWRAAFDRAGDLFFDDAGSVLAAVAGDRAAVWRVADGARVFEGARGGLGPRSFTKDGARAVVDDPPRVVDTRSGQTLVSLPSPGGVKAVIRGDGALVAGILDDGDGLAVWDVATGARRAGLELRDGWRDGSEQRQLVAATFVGDALVTLGTHHQAAWGIARHHGEPDEQAWIVAEMVTWDLERGAPGLRVKGDPDSSDRHGTRVRRPWSHFSGAHAVGLDGDEVWFRRAGDADDDGTSIEQASCVDVPVVDDDLKLAVTLDEQGTLRLWRTSSYFPLCLERIDAVVDPANAFGFPTRPGDVLPRHRIVAGACAVVETWPERRMVGEIAFETFVRLRVCPGSAGARFAGLSSDGEVILYELRPGPA